jgi:long-chain acyl-CoA synthetase
MSHSIFIRISIRFIKYFNFIYHLISYLINILLNKQWKLLNQCPDSISEESEILRTNSCWTEIKSKQSYFFAECLNVSEIFSKSVQIYKDKKCLGFRRIFSVDEEKQPNGKIFRKLALGDYQWFSYREIDERVNYIASGLLWSGIRPGDNVLLYAETNLEWMLTFQALLRIGTTVVIFRPIFTYSGENEIIHCINETEVTHIITNFDLLTILLRLESRIPLVKCIIFMEGLNSKRLLKIKSSALNLFSFSHIEQKGKWNQNLRGEKAKPDDIAGKAIIVKVLK